MYRDARLGQKGWRVIDLDAGADLGGGLLWADDDRGEYEVFLDNPDGTPAACSGDDFRLRPASVIRRGRIRVIEPAGVAAGDVTGEGFTP